MVEFNFKSQRATTIEQSERLIALGLRKETADMVWIPEVDFDAEGEPYDTGNYFERPIKGVWDYTLLEGIPAWSLHRLLSLYNLHYIEFMNDEEIESVYDIVIDAITQAIEGSYFNEKYLV